MSEQDTTSPRWKMSPEEQRYMERVPRSNLAASTIRAIQDRK